MVTDAERTSDSVAVIERNNLDTLLDDDVKLKEFDDDCVTSGEKVRAVSEGEAERE